ncbi:hypothetical protein Tco_0969377 [Tanacetum coccineum]
MPTETELTLEQTQQGVSYEVSLESCQRDSSYMNLIDHRGISKDGNESILEATKFKVKNSRKMPYVKLFMIIKFKKGMRWSVLGQSGTLVGKGSACNRGYGHRSPSAYVLRNITDIKSVLTQKSLDIFCQSFHIADDVHPQLPSPNQTIHEMPTGKIVYILDSLSLPTFDYLFPLFLLTSILLLVLLPFRGILKFSEPFLCLIGISHNYTLDEDTYPTFLHDDGTDLLAFIQVADPTKVKVGERERAEKEARLLDSIVRRVVLLLPIASARPDSELEASIDMLFDEGGSADQTNSAGGGGQETETEIVMSIRFVADENVVTEKPKRPRKKRQGVTNASGSSDPPKKLRGDHETSSRAATVSATPEHESGVLTNSITELNLRTIGASERFVISSDSSHHFATNASRPEDDSIIRSAAIPPVITEAVVTSHAVNIPLVPEMGIKVTPPVHASMFHDFDSTETVKADTVGPSYSAKQDLSMGSRELKSKTMRQVFVPQWNMLNDSLLDDYDTSQEFFNVGTARQACLNAEVRMRTEYCLSKRKRLESEYEKQAGLLKAKDDEVENLKAQLLLKEAEAAKVARLHDQVSADEAMDKMRADEIDALKQRNVVLKNEKNSLDGKVAELQSSIAANDLEVKDLNVAMSYLRSQKDGLMDQVSGYERLKEKIEEFQDAQMNIVDDKVAKLDIDLLEMALHLEEKFYPHLLTTISGRRWLLTHGLKLAIVNCLNSQENLSTLEAAISRAIEKGMQDGFSASIDHGKAGRSLADVVAYNQATKADYNSALQRLREVGPLADAPGIMSTTFASTSSVPPITIEDYEIVGTDGLEDAQGNNQENVAPFPIVEFEKEELDTTPERDPPS